MLFSNELGKYLVLLFATLCILLSLQRNCSKIGLCLESKDVLRFTFKLYLKCKNMRLVFESGSSLYESESTSVQSKIFYAFGGLWNINYVPDIQN